MMPGFAYRTRAVGPKAMRQQEDFRTPGDGAGGAADGPAAPIFDEQSALKAAPVVPLDKVARRERFARRAGGWRETVRTPQFRRSWPLALLLVATLAAAVAATNIYNNDGAQNAAPTNVAATAASAADATAPSAAETTAAETTARDGTDNSPQARGARRDSNVSTDAAAVGNSQALAASALGNLPGNTIDSDDEQGDTAASGSDERGGERDKGKRQKRSKRRHGAKRASGGAILFDVIR